MRPGGRWFPDWVYWSAGVVYGVAAVVLMVDGSWWWALLFGVGSLVLLVGLAGERFGR